MKLVLFVAMMGALTGMLLDTAGALERVPAIEGKSIPVDYEHVGNDLEYVHGSHCIDGRTF